MFGKSWSEDKLAAFSESTCWASFPYFTWVLSPALEWSSTRTKPAEHVKLACDTVLHEMQSRYHLQFAQNTNSASFVLSKSWHGQKGGGGRIFCRKPKLSKASLSSFFCLPLFLTLFRWVLHCSLSHVYWPKLQCEIQNNCSPQLPWHSLAHCAGLLTSSRKSNWDRIFQK